MRKIKREIRVGNVKIGGSAPIAVQSMTKTKTLDVKKTVNQIKRLQKAGCELIRLAVVNKEEAVALKEIKKKTDIPLIADIHFDYRLALLAIDAGIDKVRINPGNIGDDWKIQEIIKKAKDHNIPIRIGINAGSLPKAILQKYHHPKPEAIIETLSNTLEIFYKNNFFDIVISAKCASVIDTIKVYESIHNVYDFPLHLGVTEAGLVWQGSIRSAVGIGILLYQGIGDTIRVSLTGDPVKEVIAGYEILSSLNLRQLGPKLITCPTCGRCEVNLSRIAQLVERKIKRIKKPLTIAVMGCVVNGPGEAREADFGIACGKRIGSIFARGVEVKRAKESRLVDELWEVINAHIDN